jgi:hypothetical protein
MGRHVIHGTNEAKYIKFKELYLHFSKESVRRALNITEDMYNKFYAKAFKDDLKENEKQIEFNTYAKKAYSDNEDDYATTNLWPARIQTVIVESEITELGKAIQEYKLTIKK